jgi:hypothetical protein
VQILRPFNDPKVNVSVSADLIVRSGETIEVIFNWQDDDGKIVFSNEPRDGRFSGLWQQTCFEMFIQPEGGKSYYEINLTPQRAWNVFSFEDYRLPQPPAEFSGAELKSFSYEPGKLRALFTLKGAQLEKVKASYCAVIVLKDTGVSYWSVKHADSKPNFHHFESFITERAKE